MNSYVNDTILDSMDFMLLFIDLVLYLKAFERLGKVRPPYSLSHRQNGKKVYTMKPEPFFAKRARL